MNLTTILPLIKANPIIAIVAALAIFAFISAAFNLPGENTWEWVYPLIGVALAYFALRMI